MKILMTIIILATILSSCGGGGQQTVAPPVIDIVLKQGVVLKHATHSDQSCESCHQCGVNYGKITILSRVWAHTKCKGCHTEIQKGPTTCKGCHTLNLVAKAVAASVSVSPSGDVSYTIQGSGMDGVAGIQINITYDAASLSMPTIVQGGLVAGAMLAANTSIPGSIKIAIVGTKAFSGSGAIATISFSSKTGSGGIISANVSMINSAGTAVPASVSFTIEPSGIVQDPSPPSIPPSIPGLPVAQPTQLSCP
jgi:hypothetical protein